MNGEILSRRLPDGGPLYRETDLSQWIAEPWNAISSMAFILAAIWFYFKVRHDMRRHWFLALAVPVMLVGGIGGTLYHGLRSSPVFLAMDVAPIYILAFGFSLWMWRRVLCQWVLPVIIVAAFLASDSVIYYLTSWPENVKHSAAYGNMGAAMILPLILLLIKEQFAEGKWALLALAAYGLGLSCRVLDAAEPPLTPVGTHFLWHLFCATGTSCFGQFVYRLALRPPEE